MTRGLVLCAGIALAMLAVGCSSGPRTAVEAANYNACSLLTDTEVQQAFGGPVTPGAKGGRTGEADRYWALESMSSFNVRVSVVPYDDAVFQQALANPSSFTHLQGVGEDAFRGYTQNGFGPYGDLFFKSKGYTVYVSLEMTNSGAVLAGMPAAPDNQTFWNIQLQLAKSAASRL